MKRIGRTALAVFLSLAIMVTFVPVMGGNVYAASKLKAPKVKVASVTDTSVTLSWSKVKSAKGYIVYEKVSGKYKVVAKTKSLKATVKKLASAKTYYFKVRAAKKANYKGAGKYSSVIKAKTGTTITKASTAAANKLYKESAQSADYAEYLAKELAFNDEYWDSNEGWRTAGSAAEHKAARYIKKEFESIGLEDVHLEKGDVDKWQFNDATLEVSYEDEDGVKQDPIKIGFTDDEDDNIISYAASGTEQAVTEGTAPAGTDYSNIEIVDCGTGSMDDFYGKDVEGKLALVGIDQYNKVWITQSYNEAYTQGAAGVIAYQKPEEGYQKAYASYDNDANHVQDICSDNLGIPCADISYNNAQKIIKALDEGKNVKADLFVDNEVLEGGFTYNVVGKIPGTANTGQQMVYAGHYDKYFYGFEDDCLATGLVGGIAKAMIDSGFKPANDIYFIAHGAEEWGQSGTDFDWATGSWRTITANHPEWQGTTLALFNFELPAIDNGSAQLVLSSAETATVNNGVLKSGILDKASNDYPYIATHSPYGFVSSDAICFEENGVPSHMNYTNDAMAYSETQTCWKQNRYHTQRDTINEDETMFGKLFKGAPDISQEGKHDDGAYSKKLMQNQIETWGALGISYDQNPALVLDFTGRTDILSEAMFDENGENTTVATSKQASTYKDAVDELNEAAEASTAEGNAINDKYNAALKKGDSKTAAKVRKEAQAYNTKVLKAFRALQDGTSAIEMGGLYTDVPHSIIQDGYDIYSSAYDTLVNGGMGPYYNLMAALWGPSFKEGFPGRGMMEDIGYFGWAYGTTCTPETLERVRNTFINDRDNWGKNVELLGGLKDVFKTTSEMYTAIYYEADYAKELGYLNKDAYLRSEYGDHFEKALAGYMKAAKSQVRNHVDNEIEAIYDAADIL